MYFSVSVMPGCFFKSISLKDVHSEMPPCCTGHSEEWAPSGPASGNRHTPQLDNWTGRTGLIVLSLWHSLTHSLNLNSWSPSHMLSISTFRYSVKVKMEDFLKFKLSIRTGKKGIWMCHGGWCQMVIWAVWAVWAELLGIFICLCLYLFMHNCL